MLIDKGNVIQSLSFEASECDCIYNANRNNSSKKHSDSTKTKWYEIRIDWKWRRFADQMNQKSNFFNFSSISCNQICISLSKTKKQVFLIITRVYSKWLSCQILAINEMGSDMSRDRFVVLEWYQDCVYMSWVQGFWLRCCQRWRRVAATTSRTLRTPKNGGGCSWTHFERFVYKARHCIFRLFS